MVLTSEMPQHWALPPSFWQISPNSFALLGALLATRKRSADVQTKEACATLTSVAAEAKDPENIRTTALGSRIQVRSARVVPAGACIAIAIISIAVITIPVTATMMTIVAAVRRLRVINSIVRRRRRRRRRRRVVMAGNAGVASVTTTIVTPVVVGRRRRRRLVAGVGGQGEGACNEEGRDGEELHCGW